MISARLAGVRAPQSSTPKKSSQFIDWEVVLFALFSGHVLVHFYRIGEAATMSKSPRETSCCQADFCVSVVDLWPAPISGSSL